MINTKQIAKGSLLLALFALGSGCVVAEPREGYYDHEHSRYYHEHQWHECGEHAEYCR
jgi:hypothetical protein